MKLLRDILIALLVLIVILMGVWGCFGLTQHAILAIDKIGDAAGQIAEAGRTINRPKWGTLAETDKTLLAVKSVVVHGDMVIDHEDKQLKKYDGYVADVSVRVQDLTAHVDDIAVAATESAHKASRAIDSANDTIRYAQPLLASLTTTSDTATSAIESLNGRIRDPQIDRLMAHIESMTASGDGILGDGRKVADHATAEYLRPVPWYLQPVKRFGDLTDIGAALARHMP